MRSAALKCPEAGCFGGASTWLVASIVATLGWCWFSTSVRADPLFQTGFLSFDVGGSPFSVAIGDLNGDGRPDLTVANYSSGTVSVLLGNGNGTFGTKTDFATGG